MLCISQNHCLSIYYTPNRFNRKHRISHYNRKTRALCYINQVKPSIHSCIHVGHQDYQQLTPNQSSDLNLIELVRNADSIYPTVQNFQPAAKFSSGTFPYFTYTIKNLRFIGNFPFRNSYITDT